MAQDETHYADPYLSDPASFPEFVTFDVRTPSGQQRTEITVRLKRAIRLFEDSRFSEYFRVRAIAKKRGKRELGLHSCCTVIAEPRDWSEGVDRLSSLPPVGSAPETKMHLERASA